MVDRSLIKYFFKCADNQLIEFAILRARLNKNEKEVLTLLFDQCMTQEEAAESMCYSVRRTQQIFYDATDKLLTVEWVKAYCLYIKQQAFKNC